MKIQPYRGEVIQFKVEGVIGNETESIPHGKMSDLHETLEVRSANEYFEIHSNEF